MRQSLFVILGVLLLCVGCNPEIPSDAERCDISIFPDYDSVVVPVNIAPLNFKLPEKYREGIAVLKTTRKQLIIRSKDGVFNIPSSKWKDLLQDALNSEIKVSVYGKNDSKAWILKEFPLYISADSIDGYLTYRRIFPGYRMWSEMGIYQRSVENFVEKAIVSNRRTGNSCVNCHSFCSGDGDKLLFHQRSNYGGTYLTDGDDVERISLKDNSADVSLVYPYWHPSGRYVAFSLNETHQDFHYSDSNRIEVYDMSSDIVIYDVENKRMYTVPLLSSSLHYETFPAFTPDGKSLIFCSADSVNMPADYRNVRYNLLKVSFDPEDGSLGLQVDTLFNAKNEGRSAVFPRVSPDGKYLLYTVSDYGNFTIWHNDSDLRMLDLQKMSVDSLSIVNSNDVESYHSWSSNSRWFVFSSRRMDGQYTRLFITHVDENGKCSKPFLLPQMSPDYYDRSLFSFNIPEFSKNRTRISEMSLMRKFKALRRTEISLERK